MIWVCLILVKLFEIFSVNSSHTRVFLVMVSVKCNRRRLGLYTNLFCMCVGYGYVCLRGKLLFMIWVCFILANLFEILCE